MSDSVSETIAANALLPLNDRLRQSGLDISESTLDAWSVSAYMDALVFSSLPPLRSNRLYLVKGQRVVSFSPSLVDVEDAYQMLNS